MKQLLLAVALVALLTPAHAATAYWTGQMRFGQSVTYQQGVNCEYNLFGRRFWVFFIGNTCPMSIEIE